MTASEVVDVVDGAVDILDDLETKRDVTSPGITCIKVIATSMVQARSPYSVFRLSAGGGPKVRLLASLGPE